MPRYFRVKQKQSGAAILTALLMVSLVASLSAAALWQQWRGIEIETSERTRLQSAWILQGALDWARLILREDASAGSTDHLSEPWAVPLQEARLSTFLAVDNAGTDASDSLRDVFLSGQIVDLQSRLNVMNLVQDNAVHEPSLRAFDRLFEALRLPQGELIALAKNLQTTLQVDPALPNTKAALLPRTVDQLLWLGLSAPSIAVLRPHIVMLPERTAVNLNTAGELVLYASVPGLSRASAQRLVTLRAQDPFRNLSDVAKAMDAADATLVQGQHSVNTRYFEIRVQLRLDGSSVVERATVRRDGLLTTSVHRERIAQTQLASLQ
jgi:general secretion pathway protein K